MSKTVYSYQEIETLLEQGRRGVFTCYPEARVSALQKHPESDAVTVTLTLSIRETCLDIVEDEYASLFAVLDAFDIDTQAEIWEVGVRQAGKVIRRRIYDEIAKAYPEYAEECQRQMQARYGESPETQEEA